MKTVRTIQIIDFAQILDFFGYFPNYKEAEKIYDDCFKNIENITDMDIRSAAIKIKKITGTRKHLSTISDMLFNFRYLITE